MRSASWTVAFAVFLAAALHASGETWVGAPSVTGNWFDAANWSGVVPLSGEATIDNGGTALYPGGGVNLTKLTLGQTAAGSGTLLIGGSAFLSNATYVGDLGSGTLVHGGAAAVGDGVRPLYLAFQTDATGHYALNSGTLNMSAEYAGYRGIGTFIQSGGTNQVSSLFVGNEPGSLGRYELSSGQANVTSFLYLGYRGTGTFTQTGGSLSVGTLEVAARTGSKGTYHFEAGQINAAEVCVGYFGDGTMLHSDGALTTSLLRVGFSAQSSGRYDFAGGTIRADRLRIDSGTFVASAGADVVVCVGSLTVQTSSQIDLNDNAMIVDYSSASPIGEITALLASGFDDGAWDGAGIASTLAGQSPGRAIAAVEASQLVGPAGGTFHGVDVDSSAVLLEYARAGDSNLDGEVNPLDLGALASNWQAASTWSGGDFNYDGFVDIDDLTMLATNWQATGLDQALASFGLPQMNVPEPAHASSICMLAGFLRRRR